MRIEKISEKEIKCTFSKTDLKKRSLSAEDVINNTEKSDLLSSEAVSAADKKFHIASDGVTLSAKPHANSNGSLSYMIKIHSGRKVNPVATAKNPPSNISKVKLDPGIFMDIDGMNDGKSGGIANVTPERPDNPFDDFDFDDFDPDDLEEFEGTFNLGDGNSVSVAISAVPINDEMMANALYMIASDGEIDDADFPGENPPFLPLPDFLQQDSEKKDKAPSLPSCRIYRFPTFKDVSAVAGSLASVYHGNNSLYRDKNGEFLLVLNFTGVKKDEAGKAVAVLSEFASTLKGNQGTLAYIREHMEKIIEGNAVQIINVI